MSISGSSPCQLGVGNLGSKCVEVPTAGTNTDGFCDPGEICKAVGELEDNPPGAVGGTPVRVYFTTFDPNQRVGVIHDLDALTLKETVVVSFMATPNAASALNLFSANSGLWTEQGLNFRFARHPTAMRQFSLRRPMGARQDPDCV